MIEIKQMDFVHVEAIAELEKLCFSDPWPVEGILPELTNPLSNWLVAVDGDRLVGYIGSQAVEGEADVMNVAVHPNYRRKNIARSLIESLILLLKDKGIHCLSLEVRASNEPAIYLYHVMDFCQVGRRPNYYRNPKEDALILRKEWEV